jgi:hypothetical protein
MKMEIITGRVVREVMDDDDDSSTPPTPTGVRDANDRVEQRIRMQKSILAWLNGCGNMI